MIAEARRVVGDGPTYLSFDVDGLDPVYAPGYGHAGDRRLFSTHEAQRMIRGLRGVNLVGADVVEVAPRLLIPPAATALVGATLDV